MSADLVLTRITIVRELTADGQDDIHVEWDPDTLGLVEALGILEFAKDSIMRNLMGEEPES